MSINSLHIKRLETKNLKAVGVGREGDYFQV